DALHRAVDRFGPQVWQNANFQPSMFKLAEIAGYVKVMDSALWRTEWLRQHVTPSSSPDNDTLTSGPTTDVDHLQLASQLCAAFFAHAGHEIERLHDEFESELALLEQGLY